MSFRSRLTGATRRWATTLACALPLGLAAVPAAAASYSGLVVFGDSLSDPGNVYALTQAANAMNPAVPILPVSPPYAAGRFSNGPVAAEVLADRLGLAGNVDNYAFGGAGTGVGNLYPSLGNTGLQSQVSLFQSSLGVGGADAAALYLVWAGPNDFFAPGVSAATVVNAVGNIATAVGTLYGLGARELLVPLMPDLGLLPSVNGNPLASATASFLSLQFNLALQAQLASLSGALPGLDLTVFDTFSLFHQAVAAPGTFGFTNVQDACLAGGSFMTGGTPCANPGSYLFWDDVHPTAAGHLIVGERMAALLAPVPEPSTWALMAGGALLLVVRARRRA